MKAKKLIAVVVLIAFGASAQAQIVSSRSDQVIVHQPVKVKKPRTFKWNIRAGYSFDNMIGGHDLSGISGFDASFGISKPFSSNGLFWGIEAGAMTYGARMEDSDATSCIGINITPRIGINLPFAKEMALNIYAGPYVVYDFGAEEFRDIYYMYSEYTDSPGDWQYRSQDTYQGLHLCDENIDVGINLGIEFFVSKNFFFNLYMKKGFISLGESVFSDSYYDTGSPSRDYYNYEEKDIFPLKIVLGIGVQF